MNALFAHILICDCLLSKVNRGGGCDGSDKKRAQMQPLVLDSALIVEPKLFV